MSVKKSDFNHLPSMLVSAIDNIYIPTGLTITTAPNSEAQSQEYSACRLGIDNKNIIYREAKTTPTKIGQFVTVWKRPNSGDEIMPFDMSDDFSHIVIATSDQSHRGQFVFNKEILVKKGVISSPTKAGKRAIRIYPPWTNPTAKQAITTQKWQLECFFPIDDNGCADIELVNRLFGA